MCKYIYIYVPVYMYVCIDICVYRCVYIYIYRYTCHFGFIHTLTQVNNPLPSFQRLPHAVITARQSLMP